MKTLVMRARNSARVLAAAAGLLTFGLPDAGAAERACAAITIGADPAFAGRFPDLLARVREELSARDDLDSVLEAIAAAAGMAYRSEGRFGWPGR